MPWWRVSHHLATSIVPQFALHSTVVPVNRNPADHATAAAVHIKPTQVAAVILWISRGCFIVQTRWVSYRISVGYRKFIIFGWSVYGYCKDDKTVCSVDGDSSLCSSLFTKYKISIFFLFLSPIPRETTHKSLKQRLLHLSSFCNAPCLQSLILWTSKN